ncbi:MAG: hypothetical protein V3R44_04755 [bacterium]
MRAKVPNKRYLIFLDQTVFVMTKTPLLLSWYSYLSLNNEYLKKPLSPQSHRGHRGKPGLWAMGSGPTKIQQPYSSSPLATLRRGVPRRGAYITLPLPLPSREGSKPRHLDTPLLQHVFFCALCGSVVKSFDFRFYQSSILQ